MIWGIAKVTPFGAFCLFINSTDQFLLIQIISASTLVCVMCVCFAALLRLLESVYSRQGKYCNYVICYRKDNIFQTTRKKYIAIPSRLLYFQRKFEANKCK